MLKGTAEMCLDDEHIVLDSKVCNPNNFYCTALVDVSEGIHGQFALPI